MLDGFLKIKDFTIHNYLVPNNKFTIESIKSNFF